jgi:hypothetical protein
MLFVVNDRRNPPSRGQPALITVTLNDDRDKLMVVDIATGEELSLQRKGDHWQFTDTIDPAWYRIYAAVPDERAYAGPGPLPAGPKLLDVRASRAAEGGVQLRWKLPFDDWVGCDVARYRIYRGPAEGRMQLLDEIDGRIVEGGGGVVDRYHDLSAETGRTYVYALQTVSPLRRAGPMSRPVPVGP